MAPEPLGSMSLGMFYDLHYEPPSPAQRMAEYHEGHIANQLNRKLVAIHESSGEIGAELEAAMQAGTALLGAGPGSIWGRVYDRPFGIRNPLHLAVREANTEALAKFAEAPGPNWIVPPPSKPAIRIFRVGRKPYKAKRRFKRLQKRVPNIKGSISPIGGPTFEQWTEFGFFNFSSEEREELRLQGDPCLRVATTRWDELEALQAEIPKDHPDRFVQAWLAWELCGKRDPQFWRSAWERVRSWRELDPHNGMPHFVEAVLWISAGRPDLATQSLNECISAAVLWSPAEEVREHIIRAAEKVGWSAYSARRMALGLHLSALTLFVVKAFLAEQPWCEADVGHRLGNYWRSRPLLIEQLYGLALQEANLTQHPDPTRAAETQAARAQIKDSLLWVQAAPRLDESASVEYLNELYNEGELIAIERRRAREMHP